ncbi:MAG: metallophosphoesterase [Candidatus Margulisiibacteriota bacterium]
MKKSPAAIMILGVFLPIIFAIYIISGHGMLDYFRDFYPVQLGFWGLGGLAVAVLAAALIERKWGGRPLALIVASFSIMVTIFIWSYLTIPRLIQRGVVQPINFLQSDERVEPSFRFAAAGDPHLGAKDNRPDLTLKMIGQVKTNKYQAFFLLGDLVQLGFNDQLWKQALMTMSLLGPVPVGYVLGNHDAMFFGDALFAKYVRKPPFWQRIDRGRVHFLLLDLEWDDQLFTREQESWLQAQLAQIPREDWCVVMSHTFYYCSGRREDGWDWFDNKKNIGRVTPYFEKNGVDIVLSGHEHHAEVLRKNGVTYAVVGTFGGVLSKPPIYISPASLWCETDNWAFADITLSGENGVLAIRDPAGRVLFKTTLRNRR